MNWLSFIKRLSLVICLFGTAPQHTHAVEALIAGAIGPVVIPIARDVLREARSSAGSALRFLAAKKTRCKLCNSGSVCRSKMRASVCKSMCTRIIQVGGQEIRIRFGEGDEWNLAECVRKAVQAGNQDSYGNRIMQDGKTPVTPMVDQNGNPLNDGRTVKMKQGRKGQWIEDKSIAVYSQADLNYLLRLLAIRTAAEEIVNTNASRLTSTAIRSLRANQVTKQELIAEAQETIKNVNDAIERQRFTRFGNQ
ncbi:hypothetical protein [Candidatus Odyssella thessalonicensis]|uniref:hypothetical protein n=1 Tax=Candidatus Odyssella thessalonicensis TaxID=84647 RepID=UPI000225B940|nr:hypothetical protein [Candidatus Odyssella thessalonicensis]